MGVIGKYDYPNLKVQDAISAIKKIDEMFNGHTSNMASLASALGHKTHKSGGFLQKLADLRKYKLIKGRGEIILTDLAQRILRPKSKAEENQAYKEVYENIPILKLISSRLKGKTADKDFWIILQEITNVDRKKAQDEAVKIRKFYNQMLPYISNEQYAQTSNNIEEGEGLMNFDETPQVTTAQQNFTYNTSNNQVIIRFKPTNLHFSMAEEVIKELKEKFKEKPKEEKKETKESEENE